MSNLPLISDPYNNNIEDSELILLSSLDDNVPMGGSWSLYQEILQSQIINIGEINVAEQHSATARLLEKGLQSRTKIIGTTNNSPNSKTRKRKMKVSGDDQNATMEDLSADDQESSVAKKLHHNAKERIRRMKLNASYLALRALMPDSRRSKKRWSAPAIIDRVLKYIPELETEVEALKSKKENVKSAAKDHKKINVAANDQINPTSEYQSPTVFVNKINREEAIIQICLAREDNDRDGSSFTNLLRCLEDEDICIKNSSVLHICERRICCNLHIQINHTTTGADYNVEELSDKVISWFR